MKFAVLLYGIIFVAVLPTFLARPSRNGTLAEEEEADGWWEGLKKSARSAFDSWQESLGGVWEVVLEKADNMRNWSIDTFRDFKLGVHKWLDAHDEVPQEEKEEIEDFILKQQPSAEPEFSPYPVSDNEDENDKFLPPEEHEFSPDPFSDKEENDELLPPEEHEFSPDPFSDKEDENDELLPSEEPEVSPDLFSDKEDENDELLPSEEPEFSPIPVSDDEGENDKLMPSEDKDDENVI